MKIRALSLTRCSERAANARQARVPLAPIPVLFICALPFCAAGQSPGEIKEILERLSRLEDQNRELVDEVRALRQQLTPPQSSPTAQETAPSTDNTVTPESTGPPSRNASMSWNNAWMNLRRPKSKLPSVSP